ncbi:hypothetical protein scyTo_0023109, partial [Scyliorhinus torazame]|nr:hypothetical protein [Scyliorhinus torazame]
FEADRRAFIITLNSFGTELSREDRAALYPCCGRLHPDGLTLLSKAEDFEHVRAVAEYYAEYKFLFEGAEKNSDEKTLEDKFFEYEVLGQTWPGDQDMLKSKGWMLGAVTRHKNLNHPKLTPLFALVLSVRNLWETA